MSLPPPDLTQKTAPGPLTTQLQWLLEAQRSAFGQERIAARAGWLFVGWLFAFSRKTMTQLLVSLGWVGRDWSAWYRLLSRPRLGYELLTARLFEQTLAHVPAHQPYCVALDGVPVLRASRTMPGTFWGRAAGGLGCRANLRRMQRFVHLAWLLPTQQSYTRALPLRWFCHLPEKAVPVAGEPRRREWEAGLCALNWLREQLDRAGRAAQWVHAVADGTYDANDLWKDLPARTVLVVRCARNRRLYELPEPPTGGRGRGRPPVYGTPAPLPKEWLHRRVRWQPTTLWVRAKSRPLKYHVAGPYLVEGSGTQPLFLLVVKGYSVKNRAGTRKTYRPPSYLLVNAVRRGEEWVLPAAAAELLEQAWQRWEIEVCHRELKSQFGVGELQCWSAKASLLSVQWAVWMYSLLVLSGYRAWGLCGQQRGASGGWGRGAARWSFNTLWQGYRQELWRRAEFQPVCHGSRSKRAENATWTAGLWNAAWGALRA